MLTRVLSTAGPILLGCLYALVCFAFAFLRDLRQMLLKWNPLWRYGSSEQQRFIEELMAIFLAGCGLLGIAWPVYESLKK
jgi:hypothetical protein